MFFMILPIYKTGLMFNYKIIIKMVSHIPSLNKCDSNNLYVIILSAYCNYSYQFKLIKKNIFTNKLCYATKSNVCFVNWEYFNTIYRYMVGRNWNDIITNYMR